VPVADSEYFNFRIFRLNDVKSHEEGLRILYKMDNAIAGLEYKLIRAQSGRSPNSPEWRERVEFTLRKARIVRQELQSHLPKLKKLENEGRFIAAAKELLPPAVFDAILHRAGEI